MNLNDSIDKLLSQIDPKVKGVKKKRKMKFLQ